MESSLNVARSNCRISSKVSIKEHSHCTRLYKIRKIGIIVWKAYYKKGIIRDRPGLLSAI